MTLVRRSKGGVERSLEHDEDLVRDALAAGDEVIYRMGRFEARFSLTGEGKLSLRTVEQPASPFTSYEAVEARKPH